MKYMVRVIYPAVSTYEVEADSYSDAMNAAKKLDDETVHERVIEIGEEPFFEVKPVDEPVCYVVRAIDDYEEDEERYWTKGNLYNAIHMPNGNWTVETNNHKYGCVGKSYLCDFPELFEIERDGVL